MENDITEVGYKYAMNNVNATIGLVQMQNIEKLIGSYINNGLFYDETLKGIRELNLYVIIKYRSFILVIHHEGRRKR